MTVKRTKYEKINQIQNTLEGYRRFEYDYIPFGPHWRYPNERYRYRRRGLDRCAVWFWRTVLFLFGWVLIGVCYGARVRGRKNLKAVKKRGAISICNHISFLDTLFVRQAIGHFRSFHTMSPKNNKTGVGGHIIRHGGMLPLGGNFQATKHLNAEIGRLLGDGKIVNFYPEHALWPSYQKPRPMKEGAFHYAVKHSVPVLPIFCTFQKSKRGRMKKLKINILPAIYADESLPKKERIAKMKFQAEQAWKECYETAYQKKLEYNSSRISFSERNSVRG